MDNKSTNDWLTRQPVIIIIITIFPHFFHLNILKVIFCWWWWWKNTVTNWEKREKKTEINYENPESIFSLLTHSLIIIKYIINFNEYHKQTNKQTRVFCILIEVNYLNLNESSSPTQNNWLKYDWLIEEKKPDEFYLIWNQKNWKRKWNFLRFSESKREGIIFHIDWLKFFQFK